MKRMLDDISGPIKSLKTAVRPSEPASPDNSDAAGNAKVPRITNETVATHREDVLKSARKYIYPLKHSKNKIVIITTTLVVVAVVAFFSYCTLALYRFKSYSPFLYRVTQVIPFPIARVHGHFVAYENYLFELEHYIHYYQTQEGINFNSKAGKEQINYYQNLALNEVVDNVYVQELASQHNVSVSDAQINQAITVARNENRLGSSQSEFENVLKTYYGWSLSDYKRELKTNLLKQDVVSALDQTTHQTAQNVLNSANGGADFGTLAKQYSDDGSTKNNGGQYGFPISESNVNISPQVINALFAIKPGQITGIINTGPSLEIDKNISVQDNQIQAAHIVFNLQDISTYISPLEKQQPAKIYIKL